MTGGDPEVCYPRTGTVELRIKRMADLRKEEQKDRDSRVESVTSVLSERAGQTTSWGWVTGFHN